MIPIEKYLNALFEKYTQSQEDFVKKSDRLEEIRMLLEMDYRDIDLVEGQKYNYAVEKLNNDKFSLFEKWMYQSPVHFQKKRQTVFDEWKIEYEKELELAPITKVLDQNGKLILNAIIDSPMYPIFENLITDWEQIDFKELAGLAGKIDFYNYLEKENNEQNLQTMKNKQSQDKIKWTGNATDLISLFYDLHKNGLLKCNKSQLYRMIVDNFIDKKGKDFSLSYIEKLFKPDNEGDRSKKRIDLSHFL